MEKGGWGAKGEPKTGLKTSQCPQCGEEISYASTPTLVNCPKCGALDFFGTPEQLKAIREQLGGELRREEQVSPTAVEATPEATPERPEAIEEQLGGEPRTEEQESPTSSEATDEAT